MRTSDLPFGSECPPSQVDLRRVLEMADEHGGDWKASERTIRETYFERHATSDSNRGKPANNTKLGMIAYQIIERDARLTELGQRLFAVREDRGRLYGTLARRILLDLHGQALIECIEDMVAAGHVVNQP